MRHPAIRLQVHLHAVGAVLVACLAVISLLVVGASAAVKLAAEDLRASQNPTLDSTRTAPGVWLSTQLAADLSEADVVGRRQRAQVLDYRADRMREGVSVIALAGLVAALLTGRSAPAPARADAASKPVASTTSNGMV
jgi:hypothetical protein